MLSKKKYLFITLLFATSFNYAYARDLSYNYIAAGYSTFEDSSLGIDLDGDGFSFAGAFEINENLAGTASFSNAETDPVLGVTLEQDFTAFGLIAHTPVSPTTDIFGSFRIVMIDVSASDGFTTVSDDDTGNAISVGIRSLVNDNMELNAGFVRIDAFDDSSTSTGFGAKFFISDTAALTADYSTGDDVDTWTFGLFFEI